MPDVYGYAGNARAVCAIIARELGLSPGSTEMCAQYIRKLDGRGDDDVHLAAKLILAKLGGGYNRLADRWSTHKTLTVRNGVYMCRFGDGPTKVYNAMAWPHVDALREGHTAIDLIVAILKDAAAGHLDSFAHDLDLGEIRLRSAIHEFSVGHNPAGQVAAGGEPLHVPFAWYEPAPTVPVMTSAVQVERAIDLDRLYAIGKGLA